MNGLKSLKDMLCRELEDYAEHDSVDMGSLEIIDKLAHAIKNIEKIIDNKSGYSERGYSRADDYSRRSYDDGMSYRGRRRDGMGRYTSTDGIADELRSLADNAPDEKTRRELMRMIERM